MTKNKINLGLAVREHLVSKRPISPLESAVLFGLQDLSKEIAAIKKQGYKIERRRVSYAQVLRRINEHAVLVPPKNLPVKELMLTEYFWLG